MEDKDKCSKALEYPQNLQYKYNINIKLEELGSLVVVF